MIPCIIVISIAILLLPFYIYFKSKKYDLKELFLKTAISFLFIVLALIATYNSDKFTIFNILIIIGLLLGLFGDIFLDLKFVDKERTVGYTYAGFIVFGIGHILYITALIMNYYINGGILFIILPIILTIVLSFITILLEKPLKLEYGKYKKISFLYAICLFGTLTFSLFLAIQNKFEILPLNLFLVGAVLFVISDLVLSGTFFGKGKERPIDFILNYVTYYGAQFIFAFILLLL
jgi:uncharacterized membrane protein YhhN